jgi:hypothetical protein
MGRATECMGSVTWAKTPERARATGPAPPATLRSMARPLPDPVLSRVADGLRHTGARVLCLAPPGELGLLASLYLGASDPSVRVQALLAGEPYLHGPLPGGLGILQGDPGAAEELEGPFDLIVGWASEPFVADFGPWLESLTRALRPGGHLQLDLPCAQFCPMLQACHPEAASWVLPEAEELRAALEELRPARPRTHDLGRASTVRASRRPDRRAGAAVPTAFRRARRAPAARAAAAESGQRIRRAPKS